MLSKAEAAALLSIINGHHGNAQWTDIQLESFHAELMPSMTVGEAREAVRRFYASTQGRWCGSGDINRIVKQMRAESKPSEAQVGRESEAAGLTGMDAWRYRRLRMLGNQPTKAVELTRSQAPLRIGRKTEARPAGRGESKLGAMPLDGMIGGRDG